MIPGLPSRLCNGADRPLAAVADAEGSVYVAGATDGSLAGSAPGGGDAFVSKLDRDGALLWTRQIGTAAGDAALDVAVAADGTLYLAGWTEGALGGPGTGGSDAFVLALGVDGALQWAHQLGSAGADAASRVALFGSDVAVIGRTAGRVGADAAAGGVDVFATKLALTPR